MKPGLAVGVLAWAAASVAALSGAVHGGAIEILACLAPCVIVPLGLGLIAPGDPARAFRLLKLGQPFAAPLVAGSFLLPAGPRAAALICPWLILTGLGALSGTGRVLKTRFVDPAELCFGAALLFLPVGAAWLFLSRLGVAPMGFREPIVLLTGVHFHYTGFAAPVLAGMAIRKLAPRSRILRLASLGLLGGTPLLAAGFVFSPLLKFVAVLLLSGSLLALAFIQFSAADRLEDGLGRGFLLFSALGIFMGMSLAGIYGTGEFLGRSWIRIPEMAMSHGVLNGFLFSLCGLLGWTRLQGRSAA